MASSPFGYTTPPVRSSTPVVPAAPVKQSQEIFPGALDNPRRLISRSRSTKSDPGHRSRAVETVGNDPFVDSCGSASATLQRRYSSAGTRYGTFCAPVLTKDFIACKHVTNAALAKPNKDQSDGRVAISDRHDTTGQHWNSLIVAALVKLNKSHSDERVAIPRSSDFLRGCPRSPASLPSIDSPSRVAVPDSHKHNNSVDSGYRSFQSPPRQQPGEQHVDSDSDHTRVASSPECGPAQAIDPDLVRIVDERLRALPVTRQQHQDDDSDHASVASSSEPGMLPGFSPNLRYVVRESQRLSAIARQQPFHASRIFPRDFIPRLIPSATARRGEQDPLDLVKNGGTRTAPDMLQLHELAFKNAQTHYPGRFTAFVGNLTANYTDYELTVLLLDRFRIFDPHAEVLVSREYSSTCVKPRALVQMTNESAFNDALAYLNDAAIFPTDPRRIRAQRSSAARHFTVVRRGDKTTPSIDEVRAAMDPFGEVEAIKYDPSKVGVQVSFVNYGVFLATQDCIRKGGSFFSFPDEDPRQPSGRSKGKGKTRM